MSGPPDLAALLAATARGERAAFRRLYELTASKLFGVVLRIVRDRSVAEDVVQDVYVKVWQGAGSYSAESGRPMTWLISVARNRAIDVIRRRTDPPAPSGEDEADWVAAVADPRDLEGELADLDRLRRCLEQLEPTQRRCLLEAYYHGYSREELAGRYGRPVNTIKTWLHRTSQALRACLGAP